MQWLKANKLSWNVKKTELIIFHPKNTKLDYNNNVKFKLNDKRLNPISTVNVLEYCWMSTFYGPCESIG